jgi:uncharacterized membrane protein YdjX (TVP38/TMEM64 family)
MEAEGARARRPGPRSLVRAVVRLVFLGALLASAFAVTLVIAGGLPSADRVRDWADGFGPLGPPAFVVMSAALNCVFVPGPVLAGAAGLLFGTGPGTAVAITGAVLAACAEMLIARYVAGRQVAAILPRRVRRLDEFIARRGFLAVLYVRITPGVPYTLTNYGAGLTRLRVRDMAAGTAVGGLPRTFAYVALGGSLDDLGAPEVKIAIAVLVAMAVVGLLVGRRQLRAERRARREGR